jgi:hypothetical protein
MEVNFHTFLTSELERVRLSASYSDCFILGEHLTDGLVGPRIGLNIVAKRKIIAAARTEFWTSILNTV